MSFTLKKNVSLSIRKREITASFRALLCVKFLPAVSFQKRRHLICYRPSGGSSSTGNGRWRCFFYRPDGANQVISAGAAEAATDINPIDERRGKKKNLSAAPPSNETSEFPHRPPPQFRFRETRTKTANETKQKDGDGRNRFFVIDERFFRCCRCC